MSKILSLVLPAFLLAATSVYSPDASAKRSPSRSAVKVHVAVPKKAHPTKRVWVPAHFELKIGRPLWVRGHYKIVTAKAPIIPGHWQIVRGKKLWVPARPR